MIKAALSSLAIVVTLAAAPYAQGETPWDKVGAALGKSGAEMPGGVYRVGLPRSDLHVVLDGVEVKPTLALGSWLAFRTIGDSTMVMGDLVLTESEISPVMKQLAASGIEITALHNHLLRALHDGLALSKTPFSAPASTASAQPAAIDLDTAMIDKTLGAKGQIAGGVYQVNIKRAETIQDGGMEVPVAMGSAEAINFQPTGGGKAAIAGDLVLTAAEVNPVLRALRENGIEVTALHNHMLDDQPRLFFMHFWANDDAGKLAKGMRSALDKVNVARS